ncbi:MAG TPA: DUF6218 family protein [Micromonosporaceae bacterium]|nr:DUF6218 family protein [Micromonosporaceae bacterium]
MNTSVGHLASNGETRPGELLPGPAAVDGKPVRGLLVIASGLDGGGSAAFAIWHLDLVGNPTGAWVVPESELLRDRSKARRLLAICERRALAAYDPTEALDILALTAAAARVPADIEMIWGNHLCLLGCAVDEIREARAAYSSAVELEKARTGRTLAPIEWPDPLPETAPASLGEFLSQAGVLAPAGVSPAASAALAVGRAVRWCIEVWMNTETARSRRAYLRERFGPAQPVPPSWRDAVTGVYRQKLPPAE